MWHQPILQLEYLYSTSGVALLWPLFSLPNRSECENKYKNTNNKKALDKFIVQEGAGAPAWLEPLVNKALKEGTDKTKALAIADGQIVKSLDTPTGNVDVYYDTRTGAVDIDYIGSGTTAMDEPLQMSYKPGVADEGTKGIKPSAIYSNGLCAPPAISNSGSTPLIFLTCTRLKPTSALEHSLRRFSLFLIKPIYLTVSSKPRFLISDLITEL